MNGGLVAYQDTSRLGPCRSYTHERDTFMNRLPDMCNATVPGCPSRTIEQIDRAVRDPTVSSAMASHMLYGVDSRPVDGQVFRIGVGNDFIDIGQPCRAGAVNCNVAPAIVMDLMNVLQALDDAELAVEPCKSTFGGG
jgi:hypothetical protein